LQRDLKRYVYSKSFLVEALVVSLGEVRTLFPKRLAEQLFRPG